MGRVKRIMLRLAKFFWGQAKPVRDAVAARFDQRLSEHFQAWFTRLERRDGQQREIVADLQLLADSMVRELARLQLHLEQVEQRLQTLIDGDRTADLVTPQPAERVEFERRAA